MRIFPIDHNSIILNFPGVGDIHVSQIEGGVVELLYYDHCKITIQGMHKNEPRVNVESDEYATHLCVCETESKWATVIIKSLGIRENNR